MGDKAWLAEFVVTPHIQHALGVLRAAIPRRGDIPDGCEGIVIERKSGTITALSLRVELPEIDPAERASYKEMILTRAQEAAAELLLATLTYYDLLIKQAYAQPRDEEIEAYWYAAVYGGDAPNGQLKVLDALKNTLEAMGLIADVLGGEGSIIIYTT